jgi:PIN domain nuclease of toxin-antitoxin system
LRLWLDTHIWIWSVAEPKQLSRHVQHELKDPNNELWRCQAARGKWFFCMPRAEYGCTAMRETGKSNHASARSSLDACNRYRSPRIALSHQDPADRFLAATAKVLGFTLVTADHRLLGLGKIATLANR